MEIDLLAIADNVCAIRAALSPVSFLMAVIKADACGHGLVPVARTVLAAGASALGVARLEEAAVLREAGIGVPVYLLGYNPIAAAEEIVRLNLVAAVSTTVMAQAIAAAAGRAGVRAEVQVEVDVGLRRTGVGIAELPAFYSHLVSLPEVRVGGLFCHFPTMDEGDREGTRAAAERFLRAARQVDPGHRLHWHVSATAAFLEFPELDLDLARVGVGLYGLMPSPGLKQRAKLKKTFSLHAPLTHIREVETGTGVGYGHTYVTPCATRLGVVPVGFMDGYPVQLGNRGLALVGDELVPVVGKVSTDCLVLDLGPDSQANPGDVVTLMAPGVAGLEPEEVAGAAGVLVDSVLYHLGTCCRRVYRGTVCAGESGEKEAGQEWPCA